MTAPLHVAVPLVVDDAAHPSGGNRYDRELVRALETAGRPVAVHRVGPGPRDLAAVLAAVPPGAPVLVDGLLLEGAPAPDGVQVVPLLHLPPRAPAAVRAVAVAPVVVATSGWTRERVPADGPRVVVAPPGVVPVAPLPVDARGERLRCVAALLPLKGQVLLLDALADLRDLPWRCDLVGATDLDPRYTGAVRRRAAALGPGRVRFLGAVPGDPVGRLYRDADLVVLPSLAESYGMVLAEAVACGIPVLASDVGGVREALPEVDGRRAGLLVPPGDPGRLAGALRRWLTDAELRRRLTAAARSPAAIRREWADAAATVAAVLDAVAARPAEVVR